MEKLYRKQLKQKKKFFLIYDPTEIRTKHLTSAGESSVPINLGRNSV